MNEKDENKKPMNPHEFTYNLRRLQQAQRMQDELENIEMIDRVVEFMGNDLPEAEYIIYRIQRRLRNDRKY